MNSIRERFASIKNLKLLRSTIKSQKLKYIFLMNFIRGFISMYLCYISCWAIVSIHSFYNLNYHSFTFLEYYLNKNIKYSQALDSKISNNFYLYFLLISPGRQTLFTALIIIFLLDCLLNVCLRYLGSILGSWNNLPRLLSFGRLGESSKIEDLGVFRRPLLEEDWILDTWFGLFLSFYLYLSDVLS